MSLVSLVSLPFIRNKYHRLFNAGFLIHNHFKLINNTLTHTTEEIDIPNLTEIRKGRDALDASISLTEHNLDTLYYLNNEIINRYPELERDIEYQNYVNNISNELINNYNKLIRKKEHLNNLTYKSKRLRKLLQKIKRP